MSFYQGYIEKIRNKPFKNDRDKQIFEMSLENYIEQKDAKGLTIENLKAKALSQKKVEGRNFILWQGDITLLKVDAVVNAANNSLLGGGGIDGAIHDAAGRLLLRECAGLGGCKTGDAKITKGYNLPSKTVIHTVGPIYHRDTEQAETQLISCYRRCLELCDEHHLRSIAFCLISCGVYGYPLFEGATTSLNAVTQYLKENPNSSLTDIVFTAYEMHEAHVFKQVFNGNKKEEEYHKSGKGGFSFRWEGQEVDMNQKQNEEDEEDKEEQKMEIDIEEEDKTNEKEKEKEVKVEKKKLMTQEEKEQWMRENDIIYGKSAGTSTDDIEQTENREDKKEESNQQMEKDDGDVEKKPEKQDSESKIEKDEKKSEQT